MTRIRARSKFCTVIVTVDAPPNILAEMEPHASEGLARFTEFPGFISGALHKSTDGQRLVQYLQWESEADHLACMHDPRWDDLPSTRRFLELVQSGQANMAVHTYDVVAMLDAPSVG